MTDPDFHEPHVDESDELDEDTGLDDDPDAGEESYLEDDDSHALWDGDRGNLDSKQRDTLVSLLKKEFISSDDRVEWRTLMRDPGPITTNLNNMYFALVIDERSEVAYASPARTTDNPFKTLVRDAPNSREETLLLIYLRERFRASTAAAETHVFADAIAMYEYVQRMRPDSATDKVADEGRVANAIKGVVAAGLLVKTKDEGRYRVHRAIEAMLPLTKLNQLLEAFRRLNNGDPADADLDDPGDTGGFTGKHAAPDTTHLAAEEAEAAAAEQLGEDDAEGYGHSDTYEETA